MTDRITEQEMETLILSLLAARGEQGASEAEMKQVIDWAVQARTDQALLSLTLLGKALINIDNGDVVFIKTRGTQ